MESEEKMNFRTLKLKIYVVVISVLISTSFIANRPKKISALEPFFTLVGRAPTYYLDYMLFLKQHLARIGIDLDVVVMDCPFSLKHLMSFPYFDICYFPLVKAASYPSNFSLLYSQNSSFNLFGYQTSMDYNETLGTGQNEWYLKQGTKIIPPHSQEHIEHYWRWQEYLMDEILPCLPSFSKKEYVASWSNLKGYNFTNGIIQSWGKMHWDGVHTGQQSINELVIADRPWANLNPLYQKDSASAFISDAVLDPLVWFDADGSVLPHLATHCHHLNNTHLRLHLRQNVKWQSDPEGTFTDEFFDAEDVYFTLYSHAKISTKKEEYAWIKDMTILDNYTLDIFIDGDPATPKNDPYTPYLSKLAVGILPEHYLNQTQLADGITPDMNHISWKKYNNSSFFGTGILEMSAFEEDQETQLTTFNDCWRMDPSLLNDSTLDWKNRFGDKWNLTTIIVKIFSCDELALMKFEVGEIDVHLVTDYPGKRESYYLDPAFNIQEKISSYFGFFVFNMRENRAYIGSRDPCALDPNMSIGLAIRKAIAHAIDREEINEVLHNGEYKINHYPFSEKLGIWCNPNIIHYDHNVTKAREYLGIASGCPDYPPTPSESAFPYSSVYIPGFRCMIAIGSIMIVYLSALFVSKKISRKSEKDN
ncbi:MAG: hypothetical protein GF308_01695 [Candidatus Heimdallarchaeota archaeon]|nr:hypothetical protein [Candidatus Heimdallarchaeota archaeon]